MNLTLDPQDPRPLPVQIAAAVRELVAAGALLPGETIESSRALAASLGISRGSVVTAFDQLTAEGYLVATTGSRTRINPLLKPIAQPSPAPAPSPAPRPPLIELTPGLPDSRGIVTPQWRAAWREAAAHALGTAPSVGLEALRREIAAHLRHMRGLAVETERIIVTAGAREGLTLFLRHIAGPGPLRIGVESPGYPSLRRIPPALGHTLVEVPTDSEGVTVPPTPVDALVLTPSHQYPYGESLSAARRTEVVEWARNQSSWIIEDDFDSELRYLGQPLPALASLAPERTVLLGTFSSVLSPGIACGFLVCPPRLVAGLSAQRELFGQPVSLITQTALASFMASGALRRHTGKMRRAYRSRRNLVIDAFSDVEGVELLPIHGGLHAVLLCQRPAAEVVARAARSRVGLTALADYWGGHTAPNGVVIGFGHLDDAQLAGALKVLAHASNSTQP